MQGHPGADVLTTPSAQKQPNCKSDGQGHKPQQLSSFHSAFSRPLRCWKCSWCGVKQHSRQLCSHCCCRKPRGRCQQGEGTWIQLEKAAPVPVHHPKLWVWGRAAGKRLPAVSPALGVLGVQHPWRDTQIPEGISSIPCNFVIFGNLRNVGM